MMEGKISEEDARYAKNQRRVGLYILNRFAWTDAQELFEVLDLPTEEMSSWKSALDQAILIPDPEPEPKVFVGNSRPGEDNGSAKITNDIVYAIRRDFDAHNYTTLKELGKRYGVSRQTASSIGHRQTWGHVPEV